jgi:hypothetical protein
MLEEEMRRARLAEWDAVAPAPSESSSNPQQMWAPQHETFLPDVGDTDPADSDDDGDPAVYDNGMNSFFHRSDWDDQCPHPSPEDFVSESSGEDEGPAHAARYQAELASPAAAHGAQQQQGAVTGPAHVGTPLEAGTVESLALQLQHQQWEAELDAHEQELQLAHEQELALHQQWQAELDDYENEFDYDAI